MPNDRVAWYLQTIAAAPIYQAPRQLPILPGQPMQLLETVGRFFGTRPSAFGRCKCYGEKRRWAFGSIVGPRRPELSCGAKYQLTACFAVQTSDYVPIPATLVYMCAHTHTSAYVLVRTYILSQTQRGSWFA